MPEITLNFLAIGVVSLLQVVLGFLWYGPILGKKWMALAGINKDSMKGSVLLSMVGGLVTAVVMTAVLAYIIDLTQAATLMSGAVSGALVWLGFAATLTFGSVLWEQKPLLLFAINAGFWLVVLSISGSILAIW